MVGLVLIQPFFISMDSSLSLKLEIYFWWSFSSIAAFSKIKQLSIYIFLEIRFRKTIGFLN
jgi:hypothetical protein